MFALCTSPRRSSSIRTNLTTLALARQGAQSELTDLVRSRTELECTVADLRLAVQRAGGQREALEEELATVEDQVTQKEQAIAQLTPEWDRVRGLESEEKRRLDEARARLDALYAKRGRLDKFRTKAQRDQFLRAEIASMEAFRGTQDSALAGLQGELARAKESLKEVNENIAATQQKAGDGRDRVRQLGETIAELKDKQAEDTERRKELWREDTKLESMVTHAADELRGAERTLASMMDKVRSTCTFGNYANDTGLGHRYWPAHYRPDSGGTPQFRRCIRTSVPPVRNHRRQVQHRCRANCR